MGTLKLVVSGGQTGVDRAALDAALRLGLQIGGWCPKGRKAEDGAIPAHYPLNETGKDDYRTRTDWNVRDADATLVLTRGSAPTGGTAVAVRLAKSKHHKPHLVIDLDGASTPEQVQRWLQEHRVSALNVAGSRESKNPGIYKLARAFLVKVLLADIASGLSIQNCKLGNPCRKQWQSLEPVKGLSTVKYCGACKKQVFFCHTDEELAANVRLGNCVAFSRNEAPPGDELTQRSRRRRGEPIFLGEMTVDYNPNPNGLKWDD